MHIGVGIVVTVLLLGLVIPPLTDHETADVKINGQALTLTAADTWYEHLRGFQGIELEGVKNDGMLMMYSKEAVRSFSTKGIEFPVDVVWIKGSKVVRVDSGVQTSLITGEEEVIDSAPLSVDFIMILPSEGTKKMFAVPGNLATITLD